MATLMPSLSRHACMCKMRRRRDVLSPLLKRRVVAACGAVVKLMCDNMHITCVARMALKKSQIDKLKYHLKRWKEVTMREFPDRPDLLLLITDPYGHHQACQC